MNFSEYRKRIRVLVDRRDIDALLDDYINNIRDEVISRHPLRFMETKKTVSLVASTYSYAFDKSETTGRYGNFFQSVHYDNNSGNDPVKMDYLENELFNELYPTQTVNDPRVFTVKGKNFTVNAIPSVVTSKSFIVKYYALPDKLTTDTSEHELDARFYDVIVNRVCLKIFQEIIKDKTPDFLGFKISMHKDEYDKEYSKLLLQESIHLFRDFERNVFFPRS